MLRATLALAILIGRCGALWSGMQSDVARQVAARRDAESGPKAAWRSSFNEGMVLLAQGQFELAGVALERSVGYNPESPASWSALGACARRLGLPETSRACEEELLRVLKLQEGDGYNEVASSAERLPALPDGRRLGIMTKSVDCDTGGEVWSSAAVHCRWQKEMASRIDGSSVLELGCGTGAVGMFAACLGAKSVVLTDGSPAILQLAGANTGLNWHLWRGNSHVETQPLMWGPPPAEGSGDGAAAPTSQPDLLSASRPLDWIFGSDLTYWTGAHASLCWTLHKLLSAHAAPADADAGGAGGGCRAVLAHEHRVDHSSSQGEKLGYFLDGLESLLEEATQAGLTVRTLRTETEGVRRVSLLEVSLATSSSPADEARARGANTRSAERETRREISW